MADKDEAEAATIDPNTPPRATTGQVSSLAAVNGPASRSTPPASMPSKSPSPAAARPNGAPAKSPMPDSQPMTATSSASSHPAPPQNTTNTETNGSSPYGTRSRNRTGASRPNYAEDREVDAEMDSASKKKSQFGALGSSLVPGEVDRSSGTNTRRSSNSAAPIQTPSTKASTPSHPRDNLPGMSSFPINSESSQNPPAPAPSRKRKAPGAAPVNSVSTNIASLHPSTARRAAAASSNSTTRATNLMTFERSGYTLKNNKLKADDGTVLSVDDQVYLICEPPGEPYYLARIMEFLHASNDRSQPVDSIRVNWFFRPRDIQRKVNDTRVVFASMQSDTCPITSLRGKCRVIHRSEIENLEDYRKTQDSFWYEKMFDRYIHRYYEVIPTYLVINVPTKVKKVLDERWKYVVVEIGRGKDLTSDIKSCRRCAGFCANNDSVDCAVCKNTYHMNCVRPPLLKKPARGFGWSCGPCSRKQERRLEARNGDKSVEGEEDELFEEEEEDRNAIRDEDKEAKAEDSQHSRPHPPTAEQLAVSRLWPYRYLGIHCRVEDALDYDDRIYPRASSRLGPKHQATVQAWYGHPVEMVKPADIRKKYLKGSTGKKDAKMSKDTIAALEAEKANREKRPKWIMDQPPGYIARGEDCAATDPEATAHPLFRMPICDKSSTRGLDPSPSLNQDNREERIESFMKKAKALAQPVFNLRDFSTNFLDKALELFTANDYDDDKALEELQQQKRRQDLQEPELTEDEIRKFESGVSKHGSELRNVSRFVGKSQTHGEIVRFYYMWKKTERGRRIWDNYEGRKGKKQIRQADAKVADDVADDDDDSAFDGVKATQRKRGFECKFCASRKSPQWRRAPATAPGTTVPADPAIKGGRDKSNQLFVALCQRCAGLWRRYGIQWENVDEVAKKVAQSGGRAWKKKLDEELLIELVKANQQNSIALSTTATQAASAVGLEVHPNLANAAAQDAPKKKLKTSTLDSTMINGGGLHPNDELVKKKTPEKIPEPPLIPEQPQLRLLPCEVCYSGIREDPKLITCRYCRLTVHPNCYGVTGERSDKWLCNTCENDVRPEFSTLYECLLCPQYKNEDESIMEPPKPSHKKKTEREKEKDRLEREMINQATTIYIKEQEEKGRPSQPRQALKPTAQRNWSHVICSLMHPAIKFGDGSLLKSAEGFAQAQNSIFRGKEGRCKLCKDTKGAVVLCEQCEAPVHASCAQRYGYTLGISLAPRPKNSGLKTITIESMTGVPEAKVFCREHGEKKSIFPFHSSVTFNGMEMNALKAFSMTSKSMPPGSLTGTARRADMIQAATKHATLNNIGSPTTIRLKSNVSEPVTMSTRANHVSPSATDAYPEGGDDSDRAVPDQDRNSGPVDFKTCAKCQSEVSPRWHQADSAPSVESVSATVNGLTKSSIDPPQVNGKDPGDSKARPGVDDWLCHKCFIRALKSPVDEPKESTPKPEPMEVDTVGPQQNGVNSSAPLPPSHDYVRPNIQSSGNRWPVPIEPQQSHYPATDRLSNGIMHTSPAPVPPSAPPYLPSTSHQSPRAPYGPQPFPFRDDRSTSFRPSQPMQANGYPPHPPEGSYQWRRDNNGQLIAVAYQPRGGPQQNHHTSPAPSQSPSLSAQHMRSPPVSHIRSPSYHDQGPHGPPEADSNPFAVPSLRPSHASPPPPPPPPPQQYHGSIYESPRFGSRAETPTQPHDRDSRMSNDGHMQSGASASPSVRNLVH